MSSIPGYTLEAFLAWQYNLIIEGEAENNFSRGMAESMGAAVRRPVLSKVQFKPLVAMYEPYRETIERRLDDFNEETQSWRGYAEYVDLDVPLEIVEAAQEYVKVLTTAPSTHPVPTIYNKGEYKSLTLREIEELENKRIRHASTMKVAHLEEMIERVMFDVLLSPAGRPSTTVCRLYLTETFSVIGSSNVLDHDNYDAESGNHFAYMDAFDKLWDYAAVLSHMSTATIDRNVKAALKKD
jgi:hypothetical protein